MGLELYFFNQSRRNPFLMHYKIFIFLLMINLSLEMEERKLIDNICNGSLIDSEECFNGEPRGYYYDSNDEIYKKCFNFFD